MIKQTDGNIMPILEDIIQAGVDCIDPLDPLGGDERAVVKEKIGAQVCLKGNINIGGALSLGTPDEVRARRWLASRRASRAAHSSCRHRTVSCPALCLKTM